MSGNFEKPRDGNLTQQLWTEFRKILAYKTPVFSVIRKIMGMPGTEKKDAFYVLDAPDWVNVIAFTPDEEVILVEQYRHGIHEITLEIPGGVIDPGVSEPVEAAKNELREETGFSSLKWSYLGSVSSNPALFSNRTHIFLARDCTREFGQDLDRHEQINVHRIPKTAFLEKVKTGEIHHALAVAAVSKYLLHNADPK